MILIVASNKDVASINITNQILSHYPFAKTRQVFQKNPIFSSKIGGKQVAIIVARGETVNTQELPCFLTDIDLVIFVSRHSSARGVPTFSVHTPGNLGAAEFGGLPNQVSISPGVAMRNALRSLFHAKETMKLNYEISYECTHHGPSLNVPTMFVELGSTENQWRDSKAAAAVAYATMETITSFRFSEQTAVLGIGGPHYNQKFTRMALETEIVFSHIIPKYAVSLAKQEVLLQCIEKTLETVDSAIIDWKGIKSKDKPELVAALQSINLCYRKV